MTAEIEAHQAPAPEAETEPKAEAVKCLNCGAAIDGRFCAACGQRVVPPYPSVRELAGDAWSELSGYDGRIAATARGLLRPGFLTKRYVEGQRAAFLPPVRLYLTVSVIYFLVAAAVPESSIPRDGRPASSGDIKIDLSRPSTDQLTAEQREQFLAQTRDAAWVVRVVAAAALNDPEAFRARLLTTMSRVFFAMLPVFAGIVALFYRGWRFPVSLVFATHLHAFGFAVLTLSELANVARSPAVEEVVDVMVLVFLTVYTIIAFRRVFGGGLTMTIAKVAGIGVVYLITALPAFFIILLGAALS